MNGLSAAMSPQAAASERAYRVLLAIQAGELDEAVDIARSDLDLAAAHPRLSQLALMAFNRAGDHASASELARKLLDRGPVSDADLALPLAQHLLASGEAEKAGEVARTALGQEGASTSTRLSLVAAQAAIDSGEGVLEALEVLDAAKAAMGKDVLFMRVYGELLLTAGRFPDAAEVLGRAAELAPKIANVQLLYARALKQCKRFNEASDVMRRAVKLAPTATTRRLATAALLLAGAEDEARDVYHAMIAEAKSKLKPTFAEEVEALRERARTVKIPQARLDWAWDIITRHTGKPPAEDRADWELRAKWGHLMDDALQNWLECNIDRIDEIYSYFSDFQDCRETIEAAYGEGKGVLLASGHIGMMFAGPMAVHVMGKPYRWLSSTPRISTTVYADTLISTSDLTEPMVARKVIESLKEQNIVILAIDGAMSPNAPRVEFEGQAVTYSDFTAALSYRLGVPALFVSVYWKNGKFGFVANPLPRAEPGESIQEFAARWRAAYFNEVRDQFARGPEGLRLNGGIWRDL